MNPKQLRKKFETEYLDEPKLLNFQGYTLFYKEGKSQKDKFLKAYRLVDTEQYMRQEDVQCFDIYWDGKEFNLNDGTYIGLYVGI